MSSTDAADAGSRDGAGSGIRVKKRGRWCSEVVLPGGICSQSRSGSCVERRGAHGAVTS